MSSIVGEHTSARFIQVFEAEEGEIARLLLPRDAQIDPAACTVATRTGEVSPVTAILMRTKDAAGCDLPVLSLRLPRRMDSYRVYHSGVELARMTPTIHYQLAVARDLAMVNPAIDAGYHDWLRGHTAAIDRIATGDFARLSFLPRFSIIVPLFRTPIPYFHDMIRSVLAQTYGTWELILVNASCDDVELCRAIGSYSDERIRVVELEENLGIAGNTNRGIAHATGDYIAFFDHDDLLDPRILEMYVRELNNRPDADLLYCDEDNFHEDLSDRYAPLLKPDFNLDLLYSHNYVVHMLTVSRWALEQVELAPDNTSGAQDYDLTLKIAEVARGIAHVPYVLYHWRAHAGSTNGGVMNSKPYAIAASIAALGSHFERRGIACEVEATDIACVFRERYHCVEQAIDIVVPYRTVEELEGFVGQFRSWECGAPHPALRIVAVGESKDACRKVSLPDSVALVPVAWEAAYDRVAMYNEAIGHLETEHVLFCDASVRFEGAGSVAELSGCLGRSEVGVVAPKLFYRDGLVQHAGVVCDEHGVAHFLNQNFVAHMGGGYHGYAECSGNFSAVGPDCLMVRREDLARVGRLGTDDENALQAILGLCDTLKGEGKLCTVLPHVTATVDAPVIWAECDVMQAYRGDTESACTVSATRTSSGPNVSCSQSEAQNPSPQNDPIHNQNVSLETGYPRLNTGVPYADQLTRAHAKSWRAPLVSLVKGVLGRT